MATTRNRAKVYWVELRLIQEDGLVLFIQNLQHFGRRKTHLFCLFLFGLEVVEFVEVGLLLLVGDWLVESWGCFFAAVDLGVRGGGA